MAYFELDAGLESHHGHVISEGPCSQVDPQLEESNVESNFFNKEFRLNIIIRIVLAAASSIMKKAGRCATLLGNIGKLIMAFAAQARQERPSHQGGHAYHA